MGLVALKIRVLTLLVNSWIIAGWIYRIYIYNLFAPDLWLVLTCPIGLVLLHVDCLQPGSTHDMWTLLKQYVCQSFFYVIGVFLHLRLKFLSFQPARQQKRLLQSILFENQNTKCVKLLKICITGDVNKFKETVPLTSYKDYNDLTNEVACNGSKDVMFPGDADYIALTSGTVTGESHMFPKKIEIMKRKTGLWILLAQKHFLEIPRNNFLRKWLTVTISSKLRQSQSGIRMGPISGIATQMSINMAMYVTPQEVLNHVTCEASANYIYLVFGLITEDIKNLFFPTATTALTFFKTMEREWPSVCDDISTGILTGKLELEDSDREFLDKCLGEGNAKRADFLRVEFTKGMKDIVPRVWTTCSGLFCAATGSYAVQANYIKSEYLGHLPLFSPFHAGTESLYGMNIHLMERETSYVAMTPYNFFEFIQIDDIGMENPTTCLAHEVEIGQLYEMVVTTWEGLYRYRTGDVIQVTSFYGWIPRYKFIRRSGDVLSAGSEKVPERFVSAAVQLAAEKWKQPVYDMASVENIHVETLTGHVSEKPYYIIFIQLHDVNAILTTDDKRLVDTELCRQHEGYRAHRTNGKLAPLRVKQLQYGTLEMIKEFILDSNQNASYAQYKQPRIMRRGDLLRFLIASEHSSTKS